ncbi:hypothetical protein [Haloechinothrix sp. LS1_15]|uniref:hypothetical protein n=1 Tax=Haloechinothrix sp. LS1_15 TaxID=2652248 RepID=UPI00294B3B80|nr:hypothetical protein [Haloechinothrix sp. LS1_15]
MTALPPGLTHPYETTRPKLETFRHGHTFTWTQGDAYIAVQRGRIANADKTTVLTDIHPEHPLECGKHPIVDWLPAPPRTAWHEPGIMLRLADQWLHNRRTAPRTPG